MTLHLLALSGPDKGRVFLLNEGCAQTIGRSHAHTEITLQDTEVARVHCEVALAGDALVVTDLDGSSSTIVNNEAITEHTMKPGDMLRLGQTLLRFQKEQVGRGVAATVTPTLVVSPKPVPVAPVQTLAEGQGVRPIPVSPRVAPVSPGRPKAVDRPPTLETAVVSPTRVDEIRTASALPERLLPPDRLNELAGTTLGHFELGPILGEGHTGAVFKARDTKSLRTVALRVLPASDDACRLSEAVPTKNDAERQRFIQAVKDMLHLDHVHLVKLHGAGKADGYHWLASEFVEGPNLGQIMKQGRPSNGNSGDPMRAWEPAYRIALHIGRALDYAHQHHFIHRNITPTDILVSGSGDHLMM
jgi:pSer/pThr/pTyr-binding forkhead associated (FHA) protein